MIRLLSLILVFVFTRQSLLKAQTSNVFPSSGSVGVGTTSPKVLFDVAGYLPMGSLNAVLARLPEGDWVENGTNLGVRSFTTQFNNSYNGKSFSLEHSFYGNVNSSINFFRGNSYTGGVIAFNTNNNTEQMRLDQNGRLLLGTPHWNLGARAVFDIAKDVSDGKLGAVFGRLPEGDGTLEGTFLGVRGFTTRFDNAYSGKSFAIEHAFYGKVNSSINFLRGGDVLGGFVTFNTNNNTEQMRLDAYGNLMLGTQTHENSKLSVNGDIRAKEIKVEATNWPDYVFQPNYALTPLSEIQTFITKNGHLPEIPKAEVVESNGLSLGEMNKLLLKKIEELTLHVIQLSQTVGEQAAEIESIKSNLAKDIAIYK